MLVSGLARKLTEDQYRVQAYLAINKISDVVGQKELISAKNINNSKIFYSMSMAQKTNQISMKRSKY